MLFEKKTRYIRPDVIQPCLSLIINTDEKVAFLSMPLTYKVGVIIYNDIRWSL